MVHADDTAPARRHYDVVIVGGAIMGSAAASFLADSPDFDGTVLVIERDPTYEFASTSRTNSCIRQQFSHPLNIQISQFTAHYLKTLREQRGDDPETPEISIRNFGYMYMADNETSAAILRENAALQRAAGAKTELMTPEEIAAAYPFYTVSDLILGSINRQDEGYWDGAALFAHWRRSARRRGADYIAAEVVGVSVNKAGTAVDGVTLSTGERVGCGHLINAAGPRAAALAAMAGIALPVEPRKRYTWVFSAERPLPCDLPLTIDPTGVHVREHGGGTYLAGAHNAIDPAVPFDDFAMDHALWEAHVWPALAARIPQFEAIKVTTEWAGHYAYNTLDQNAVVGPHPVLANLLFLNGFSGHGLQQSPAMGRAISEWIAYGAYRTLDLSPFAFGRILRGEALVERAII